MKIYIGDYPAHRPFYDFFEWLGISNETNHAIHHKLEKFKLIKQKQTKFIKIDRHDVWSMDYTLADIIHHMLVKFKDEVHGYPAKLDPIDCAGKTEFEGWLYIIDELIYVFGHYDELMDVCAGEQYQANQERVEKALKLFAKYYTNLWD